MKRVALVFGRERNASEFEVFSVVLFLDFVVETQPRLLTLAELKLHPVGPVQLHQNQSRKLNISHTEAPNANANIRIVPNPKGGGQKPLNAVQ